MAFELRERAARVPGGLRLRVLDNADRVGGNIRTDRERGYVLEWGPNGFLDNVPATPELVRRVGLADRAHARPHELSHGQAQRVAVARAVMNRPQLLIADEPTSNLDDAHCAAALDLLEAQATECGATLVVATHDARAKGRFQHRLELGA